MFDFKLKKEQEIIDKEYEEFVKLLKYFVDTQTPKCAEAHIKINNDGYYKITDENNKELSIQDFKMEDFETLDDILTSVLIVLSPKKIILHNINDDNKEVVLIKRIFKNVINQ